MSGLHSKIFMIGQWRTGIQIINFYIEKVLKKDSVRKIVYGTRYGDLKKSIDERGEDMKITIECTKNEINDILNNLKSGKVHEPIFKCSSNEVLQNPESFNLGGHNTMGELIKKLGLKRKEETTHTCEV